MTTSDDKQAGKAAKRKAFTTAEMLHLFQEMYEQEATYDEFLTALATVAGYYDADVKDPKEQEELALALAKERFHRLRHDLKKRKLRLPLLKGTPPMRPTTTQLLAQFDFLVSEE